MITFKYIPYPSVVEGENMNLIKRITRLLIPSFFILFIAGFIAFFSNLTKIRKIIYILLILNSVFLFFLLSKRIIRKVFSKSKIIKKEREESEDKLVKSFIYLIPLIILGYIIFINFNPFTETIFYDIGGIEDKQVLYPLGRVSNQMITDDHKTNFRELKDELIYFNVPIPFGTKSIKINVGFKGDFPEEGILKLGANNQKGFYYIYKLIYDSVLESKKIDYNLRNYPEDFPENSIIATDAVNLDFSSFENKIKNFIPKPIIINESLRGPHTILIYAKGKLDFKIIKQDLNWYLGEDNLTLNLYRENILIKNIEIPDDGIIDNSKVVSDENSGELIINDLKEGVYRIEIIGNNDLIIKKIISNQDKLVFKNKIFLANSNIYLDDLAKETRLYFENNNENNKLSFKTYHEVSLQNISISKSNSNSYLNIDKNIKSFEVNIEKGEYTLSIPKGNIIIESDNYLSFSKLNYFKPYNVIITDNFRNANYIISDYKKADNENGWYINEVSFDLKDLYIEEGKSNFVLYIPHLTKDGINDEKVIAIDWIEIKLEK